MSVPTDGRRVGENFGLTRIGQIMMPATSLDRAVAFYRDILGTPLLFRVPGMAFFDLGGIRLMLGEREEGGEEYSGSILYYAVSEIGEAHRTLSSRGVTFDQDPTLIARMEDHDLWMAFFKDCEGNQLALMEEVRST